MEDRDLAVALQLQEKFNSEASAKNMNKKRTGENSLVKSTQGSVIDTTWECVDPTPDVHGMFQSFNNRFFWGKLSAVEVKWSSRMTSCAGVCSYQGRGGLCSVRLSAPLLKLRPRKDLVETLLHEMIHAYLFVTHNNRDRDGHGPEFHKHMNRINKEAGTKITVYHSFHEEVRFYQQHWWRCDGLCQNRPPFFGTVRRASNRAPGPNDVWWDSHRATCGGTFIKIKEPEGFKSKHGATTKGGTSGKSNNIRDIRSFFPTHSDGAILKDKTHNNSGKSSSAAGIKNNVVGSKDLNKKQSKAVGNKSQANGGEGMGRISKKVGGFGGMLANKGGGTLVVTTKDKKSTVRAVPSSSKNNFVPFHGQGHTLGSSSGSNKLNGKVYVDRKNSVSDSCTKVNAATKRTSVAGKDKVSPPKKAKDKSSGDLDCKPSKTNQKSPLKAVNVPGGREPSVDVIEILDSPEKNSNVHCPVCSKAVNMVEINSHLDACVESAPSDNLSSVHCPVCNQELAEAELNQHLETCVTCVFVDDEDEEEPSESVTSSSGGGISDKLYPCPCCMTWVKPELMNHHLDECLSSKLLSEFSDVNL